MADVPESYDEIRLEVSGRFIDAGKAASALLQQRYTAPIEDVWAAFAEPDRLNRWFLDVSGDLHEGGSYQLKGNAGGTILTCDAPNLLVMSWEYGDFPTDELELKLTALDGGDTLFQLQHLSVRPLEFMLNDAESGMWGVGPAWELTLAKGLQPYLAGELPDAPTSEWFEVTDEVMQFVADAGERWTAVVDAARGGPYDIA